MKIDTVNFGNGIELGVIKTEKFKTNSFLLTFVLPRNDESVSTACMLANVLCRGTESYPDIKTLSRRLSELYDVSVNVYTQCLDAALLFRISVNYIDDRFVPKGEDVKVCEGALDFIREFLFRPLVVDGAFRSDYVESERVRCIDKINSDKNNKDGYALSRALHFSCEGTPMACSSNGTVEAVNAVTAESIYGALCDIVGHTRVEAVFAGRFEGENEAHVRKLLTELSEKRSGVVGEPIPEVDLPRFGGKEIVEQIKAKQGKLVLSYRLKALDRFENASSVFNEIFGASPVSRLFANVRERLSLCYYCSSIVNREVGLLIVRSALDKANRQKAIDEINRQLRDLSSPENISDEELEVAKASILSNLDALGDSTAEYSNWYCAKKLKGGQTDLEAVAQGIKAVTKEEVASIAASAELHVSYFLDGTDN